MAILVVVCGQMCGKIEKLSDWNKNLCGSRYGPHDYDSGDKKKKKKIVVKCVLKCVAKCVLKCVVKLKNCRIGTIIGVVVDMDPVIMIVVTKRQKGKKTKKTKKEQKLKNTKKRVKKYSKYNKKRLQIKDKKTGGPKGLHALRSS